MGAGTEIPANHRLRLNALSSRKSLLYNQGKPRQILGKKRTEHVLQMQIIVFHLNALKYCDSEEHSLFAEYIPFYLLW